MNNELVQLEIQSAPVEIAAPKQKRKYTTRASKLENALLDVKAAHGYRIIQGAPRPYCKACYKTAWPCPTWLIADGVV